jgi:hypothetical protein
VSYPVFDLSTPISSSGWVGLCGVTYDITQGSTKYYLEVFCKWRKEGNGSLTRYHTITPEVFHKIKFGEGLVIGWLPRHKRPVLWLPICVSIDTRHLGHVGVVRTVVVNVDGTLAVNEG